MASQATIRSGTAYCRKRKYIDWLVCILVFSLSYSISEVQASLPCKTDRDCQDAYQRPETICLPDANVCSNPFQQGCLKTMLPSQYPNGRICNSDDPDTAFCRMPLLHYPEIRVHNGNWESSIFLSWIIQILLMEILEVPVTIGLTPNVTLASGFYDPQNRLTYSSQAYPFGALQTANEVGSCLNTDEPCSEIMPEVWDGQQHEWTAALKAGYIDQLEGDGQVGKGSWFVPVFTAERDNSLVSVYGLSGESNRRKLADAFLRPTTWQDYCEQVSTVNCTEADSTAARYPESTTEQASYFVKGLYTGHFRATDANNCTLHPTNCSGTIIGPGCTWSTNIDSQLYWNNITLVPDGPVEPNGGYEYGSMLEIWRAAVETESNVIMWWWAPDALVNEFQGTKGEFQQVLLPRATEQCVQARVDTAERCSPDITVRRGRKAGACDQEAHDLQKIYSRSLRVLTEKVDIASRSPGYSLIRNFKVTDLQVSSMLQSWIAPNVDQYGNGARETVCSWVVENLDSLLEFIPQGYPREVSDKSSYQVWYLQLALAVACATGVAVLLAIAISYHYRHTKVFVFAQFYFVLLVLLGFFLISMGSVMNTLEPSWGTCTASVWLIVLGYTVELVPVLVKTAAINKILQSAKKMKRVQISRQNMLMRVLVVVTFVTVYLLVWTTIDPPKEIEIRVLAGRNPQDSTSNIVESSVRCSSQLKFWYYVALGWQCFLLLIATVLAVQSRNVMQEFNESQTLGAMIYSNFLFVVIRVILTIFGQTNILPSNIVAALISYNYSFDALFAMMIYLVPKFVSARQSPAAYTRTATVNQSNILSDIETKAALARASYLQSTSYRPSTSAFSNPFPMRVSEVGEEPAALSCRSTVSISSRQDSTMKRGSKRVSMVPEGSQETNSEVEMTSSELRVGKGSSPCRTTSEPGSVELSLHLSMDEIDAGHRSGVQNSLTSGEILFQQREIDLDSDSKSDDSLYDSGGPRWSKPEYNDALEQSIRMMSSPDLNVKFFKPATLGGSLPAIPFDYNEANDCNEDEQSNSGKFVEWPVAFRDSLKEAGARSKKRAIEERLRQLGHASQVLPSFIEESDLSKSSQDDSVV